MPHLIRLVLTLHNHQPVGNFDNVCEQAYRDSYKPFLDVLDHYPQLPIALHTSGCLLEWFQQHHPEYLDRLAKMVEAGRVEIVGGAYYEPILTMLPRHDRVGQIQSYTRLLQERLGAKVRGMWMPERIWEASLVSDLAAAGIEYTILDDFHFKNGGVDEAELHGYYVTEDEGKLVKVFPGSERLRYVIPFADPHETIDFMRSIAEKQPHAVLVFGDDGEKFGTWPDTQDHVYKNGWLHRFFQALAFNADWLKTTTLSEAIENVPPVGKVFIPNGSYREMTEWALPVEALVEYEHLYHEMEHDPRWPRLRRFMRSGFWRNFKVKYPETDEMYCRMLGVSQRLEQLRARGASSELLDQARVELYRGQCNCPYWHGAFGGLYLPHLRGAIYKHLIAADNLIEQATRREESWVECKADDFNLDARQEVSLSNEHLYALLAPVQGGVLYELDVRSIGLNLLASITRRPEAYHAKVLAGSNNNGNGHVASIHDRVVFKQPGLDQKLIYDLYPRKALVDHFYDNEATLAQVASGNAWERGDFAGGIYDARIRRTPTRVSATMTKAGNAWGTPFTISKTVSASAGSPTLDIVYLLEGLPQDRPFHFAVEFNLAGLPSGADDRFFHDGAGSRMGQLGHELDLKDASELHLVDEWQGIDVGLAFSRPSNVWAFPIQTVSQSEGGFELVHQSVSVQPHWLVQGDAEGKWTISIELSLDVSLAESRRPKPAAALAR